MKQYLSYPFILLLLYVNIRLLGDVNKGVWPTEVRRSNDVNEHRGKDALKIYHINA